MLPIRSSILRFGNSLLAQHHIVVFSVNRLETASLSLSVHYRSVSAPQSHRFLGKVSFLCFALYPALYLGKKWDATWRLLAFEKILVHCQDRGSKQY